MYGFDKVQEATSKHLGVPYVYLSESGTYLCANGVAFTKKEYEDGIDLAKEYALRSAGGRLYDYAYAKRTGKLREANGTDRAGLYVAWVLLAVSLVCALVSTAHTAEYLFPYTGRAWAYLMSTAVTAYCTVALEASLLFMGTRHKICAAMFALLWVAVTAFSMMTTVSVFWDRFTLTEQELREAGSAVVSAQSELALLKSAEEALRADIDFKRRDIEWRQEKDYATAAVRGELERLTGALQDNLRSQAEVTKRVPLSAHGQEAVRESVYTLIAHMTGINPGTAEFIVSTLCAVFINLISPLSVSAASALTAGKRRT